MKRWSRLVAGGVVAAAATPWLGGLVAHADTAPPSGDGRATSYAGNATTCADVGLAGDSQVGQADSSGLSQNGFDITSDGQNLTVSAIPADTTIDALVVKGGDAYNLYAADQFRQLPVSGLHAPLVGAGNVPQISHWFLCYGPAQQQQQPVSPSARIAGSCDGADITLSAGSNDTTFTITRAGDANGQTVPVAAGQSSLQHVTLDAAHPSVSVTAPGGVSESYTRDAGCDATNGGGNPGGDNPGGDTGGSGGTVTGGTGGTGGAGGSTGGAASVNPQVSADNSCGEGITLTLTNDGATEPVTFTLTAPDGAVSKIAVPPDATVHHSFPVEEDTTAVVTVSSPGLDTQTFRYHKDCATVLGVKHVRHTHRSTHADRASGQSVAGAVVSTAALPFTGFGAARNAAGGAALVLFGAALCRVGARRRVRVRSTR